MTKADLINNISEKAGCSKADAEKVLKATIEVIMGGVAVGEKIPIHGFGTFEQAERGERHGRNPRTGEDILVTATKVPKFTAFSAFKALVKGAAEEA